MSTIDPALQSFVRRVYAMMICRSVLRWSALWLMIAGVVVLGIRFTSDLPGDWWKYLFGLVGLARGDSMVSRKPTPAGSQTVTSSIRPAKPRGRLGDGRRRVDTRSWEAQSGSLALPSVQ